MCVESTSLSLPDSERSRDSAPSAPEHETPDASALLPDTNPVDLRVQRGRRARVGSRFAARVHVETEEHPCIGGWLPYPAKTSISAAAEEQSSAPFLARRWRASRSRARTRSPSSTSSVPRTRRYPRPAIDAGGRAASCAELESAFRRRPDAGSSQQRAAKRRSEWRFGRSRSRSQS